MHRRQVAGVLPVVVLPVAKADGARRRERGPWPGLVRAVRYLPSSRTACTATEWVRQTCTSPGPRGVWTRTWCDKRAPRVRLTSRCRPRGWITVGESAYWPIVRHRDCRQPPWLGRSRISLHGISVHGTDMAGERPDRTGPDPTGPDRSPPVTVRSDGRSAYLPGSPPRRSAGRGSHRSGAPRGDASQATPRSPLRARCAADTRCTR